MSANLPANFENRRFMQVLLYCIMVLVIADPLRAESLAIMDDRGEVYIHDKGAGILSWRKLTPDEIADSRSEVFAEAGMSRTGDTDAFLVPEGDKSILRLTYGDKNHFAHLDHAKVKPYVDGFSHYSSPVVDRLNNVFLLDQGGWLAAFYHHKSGAVTPLDKMIKAGFPDDAEEIIPFAKGGGIFVQTKSNGLKKVVYDVTDTGKVTFNTSVLSGPETIENMVNGGEHSMIYFKMAGVPEWGYIDNPANVTRSNLKSSVIDLEKLTPMGVHPYWAFSTFESVQDEVIKESNDRRLQMQLPSLEQARMKERVFNADTSDSPPSLNSGILPPREFTPGLKPIERSQRNSRVHGEAEYSPVFDQILAEGNSAIYEPITTIQHVTVRNLTDETAKSKLAGELPSFFGRESQSAAVLDTLIRLKGKNPVLVGEAGVGKTAIAQNIADLISDDKLPVAKRYQEILKDAIVIETSPSAIAKLAIDATDASLAKAVDSFVESVLAVQAHTNRKIIVFIDEIHRFGPAEREALKTTLDSKDGIMLIGSTTNNEFGMMIKDNKALRRRLQPVDVPEFSESETRKLLKESVIPHYEKAFGGTDGNAKIADDAIDAAIRRSTEYVPYSARPEGPIKTLQDALVHAHRKAGTLAPSLTGKDVGKYVSERLRLPLDPTDLPAFYKRAEELKNTLREEVVDQHRITDKMVDLWKQVNLGTNDKDSHKTMLIAGPTGAGKTFSAQQFAKHLLGSEERVLEIDANRFKTAADLWTLVGAGNGYLSSDTTRGILPEFLDGKGRGANVIIINELEKAGPEFAEAIMELLDTGKLQASDGNTYKLGKSLVVLTTNKGDDRIYPRGRGKALSKSELEKRLDTFDSNKIKSFFIEADPKDRGTNKKGLSPAILARIDEAVPAAPPSHEGAIKIATQEANRLSKAYAQHNISVNIDKSVLTHIVDSIYVPEDGVRSVNRAVAAVFNRALDQAVTELGAGAGTELTIKYVPSDKQGAQAGVYNIAKQGSKRSINIPATTPLHAVENPLSDPKAREKLGSLEAKLQNHVIGQKDAIDMTSKALRSRAANPTGKKPAVMLYLGSTGTGKTETAKGIALELFGDSKRMEAFDMGKIKDKTGLGEVFGSGLGYVGSDRVSAFEQFLLNHPEGGVILFDEIGNVGDKTAEGKAVKESILLMFYSMMDEGIWRNNEGKVYDISKFALVFTSNEGQELFTGLTSDDLRLSRWKTSKGLEQLTQLLKSHGWSEALIARFRGNIALFKPLLAEEQAEVGKKLVDRALKPLTETHGIKNIKTAPDFYRQLGETFFSHEQGARALDGFADQSLTDLVLRGIYESNNPDILKGSEITLSMKDNYAGLHVYDGKAPPKRKVTVNASIRNRQGKKTVYEMDATQNAAPKQLLSKVDAVAISIHEAGHAIVNEPTLTGSSVNSVSIRGGGSSLGYAGLESNQLVVKVTRENLVAQIGTLLAGREAEKAAGFPANGGWASDLDLATKVAREGITRMGLGENPLALAAFSGGDSMSNDGSTAAHKLLKDGEEYARKIIEKHEAAIHELAEMLYRDGLVDGEDVRKLREKHGVTKTATLDSKGLSKSCQSLVERIARTTGRK